MVLKPVTISCPAEEAMPAFQELKIRPLANHILLAYLKERCIDVETARKYAGRLPSSGMEKLFAIAFPNISGGYEVRNRLLRLVSPQGYYLYHEWAGNRQVLCVRGIYGLSVFEPAFPLWAKGDCLVLNSVSNLPKAFLFFHDMMTFTAVWIMILPEIIR